MRVSAFLPSFLPPSGLPSLVSYARTLCSRSGDIDLAEFVAATRVLARTAHVSAANFDVSIAALKIPANSNLFTVLGLGRGGLSLATFERFIRDLHAAVRQEEFRHYDPLSTGAITLRAFGLAALAGGARRAAGFAAGGASAGLLARLEEMGPATLDRPGAVTYDQFSMLHELRGARDAMDLMLKLHGQGLRNLFRSEEAPPQMPSGCLLRADDASELSLSL